MESSSSSGCPTPTFVVTTWANKMSDPKKGKPLLWSTPHTNGNGQNILIFPAQGYVKRKLNNNRMFPVTPDMITTEGVVRIEFDPEVPKDVADRCAKEWVLRIDQNVTSTTRQEWFVNYYNSLSMNTPCLDHGGDTSYEKQFENDGDTVTAETSDTPGISRGTVLWENDPHDIATPFPEENVRTKIVMQDKFKIWLYAENKTTGEKVWLMYATWSVDIVFELLFRNDGAGFWSFDILNKKPGYKFSWKVLSSGEGAGGSTPVFTNCAKTWTKITIP